MTDTRGPVTYAGAGVDVEAGDRAVALMKQWVATTHRPEVVGGLGGFAGLFDASALLAYRRPLLATSTDGVGTKVQIAQRLDRHDTIGFDLVGMVVDDIVVAGAEPLFMTDYIACGSVVPERIAAVVQGIAQACVVAGCALLGGETAEHPGLLGVDEYDVAGAATGVVEADDVLGAEKVRAGDVLVAMGSSGLHSNGYSLVRRVLELRGWGLERQVDELGRTIGEELLEPTRVYAQDVLDLARAGRGRGPHGGVAGDGVGGPVGGGVDVHAVSHVTGGGLAANLARVLPQGLEAVVRRSTWTPAPVFSLVRRLGDVPLDDLERTLNLGVGMIAVVAPDGADAAVRRLLARGLDAWVLGEVRDARPDDTEGDVTQGAKGVDGGAVRMVGTQPL